MVNLHVGLIQYEVLINSYWDTEYIIHFGWDSKLPPFICKLDRGLGFETLINRF